MVEHQRRDRYRLTPFPDDQYVQGAVVFETLPPGSNPLMPDERMIDARLGDESIPNRFQGDKGFVIPNHIDR